MVLLNDGQVANRLALDLHIPADSRHQFNLEYLAEGAANIIFSIRLSNSNTNEEDRTCVLRMRKALPFTTSTTIAKRQFEQRIAPLFAEHATLLIAPVQLKLSHEVIQSLNEELHKLEVNKLRPTPRKYVYLPPFTQEPYALLMQNLRDGSGEVVEFKPKWLVQSPSAPTDARRCRTCALNAMRRRQGEYKGRGDSGFCPFDLLSEEDEVLTSALGCLWKDTESLPFFADAFWRKVQPALRHLQDLQGLNGDVGLRDFLSPEGKDFSVAMALRDCSVFLKVERTSDPLAIDITLLKILDLDLKETGGGKLDKWAGMEKELIDGGWYMGIDDLSARCAMSS